MMNRISWIGIAVALLISVAGCSDEPTGNNDGTVSVQATLEATSVSRTVGKTDAGSTLSGAEVDSLHVTRVRVLISELKLHRDKEDTLSGDKHVKTGPILITAANGTTSTVATGTIASGTYDKLKFEFHRFSSSEVPQYLSDTTFADFATDKRYTVIVDGTVYNGGESFPFTYRSDATVNLEYKFDPGLTIVPGTTLVIVVSIDPADVFRKNGKILDPRDGSNESAIDNAIKSAFKALKK